MVKCQGHGIPADEWNLEIARKAAYCVRHLGYSVVYSASAQ